MTPKSPAKVASEEAMAAVRACLEQSRHFRLEAGAGAGKTYSLIESLKYFLKARGRNLLRNRQQIACITFTNVARDEILARTDRSPLLYSETNHAFCWKLISQYQSHLRRLIDAMEAWKEKLTDVGGTVGTRAIEYSLGYRAVREKEVSIGHDDVIALCIKLFDEAKFRAIVADRFPIVLIDEYQDTDREWIEAVKQHFLDSATSPLFGFFGDHWQKIYGDGCGKLEHKNVQEIGKKANFRSVDTIVQCLNRLRPELPQFVEDPALPGQVIVLHTNSWKGERQKGPHYGGDLHNEQARKVLEQTKMSLQEGGWDFSPSKTKVLMLTHRSLALEQGYTNLAKCFQYNDSFTKKENSYIAFFVDVLEPVCEAFQSKQYGRMFSLLGQMEGLRHSDDKAKWTSALTALLEARENGAVSDVIASLQKNMLPALPEKILRIEKDLAAFDNSLGEEMPRSLKEAEALKKVSYSELIALRRYLDGVSPFETKHGVKGAQFENVLVVLGRGWNKYNYNLMLEMASKGVPTDKKDFFESNRNLFYVCCSRPQKRLCLLFTQELSEVALGQLRKWFGAEAVRGTVVE